MFHHLLSKHPIAAGAFAIATTLHSGTEGGKLLVQTIDLLTHNPRAEHTLFQDIRDCATGSYTISSSDPYSVTRNVMRLVCH